MFVRERREKGLCTGKAKEELWLWKERKGGGRYIGRGEGPTKDPGMFAERWQTERPRRPIASAYRAAPQEIAECLSGGTYQDVVERTCGRGGGLGPNARRGPQSRSSGRATLVRWVNDQDRFCPWHTKAKTLIEHRTRIGAKTGADTRTVMRAPRRRW